MSLRRLRSDLVQAEEGWTVWTVGREEVRYVAGDLEMAVEVEHAVSDVPERAFWYVHRDLVCRIGPDGRRDVVPGNEAGVVLERVVRALDLLGVDTEFVGRAS